MINFDYLLSNIVSTSRLIASQDALWRAWIERDCTISSAYDAQELIEQLLGDLDLKGNAALYPEEFSKIGIKALVDEFVSALELIENKLQTDARFRDPGFLLQSEPWNDLRRVAKQLQDTPANRS